MTTITDPRAIAATLDMDTYQLAEQLVTWANDALGPMPLEDFDAQVEKARRYLENAHEAFKAWMQDNPEDEPQS
jgi:hypothetical protein